MLAPVSDTTVYIQGQLNHTVEGLLDIIQTWHHHLKIEGEKLFFENGGLISTISHQLTGTKLCFNAVCVNNEILDLHFQMKWQVFFYQMEHKSCNFSRLQRKNPNLKCVMIHHNTNMQGLS